MKKNLDKFVPLGLDANKEIRYFTTAIVIAVLFSTPVIWRFAAFYNGLFFTTGTAKVIYPGAVMAPFRDIIGIFMLGFPVAAVYIIGFAVFHYSYHTIGSKSIYLMKRLPDSRELHRRCLTLPLTALAATVLIALLILAAYYAMYILITPDQCLVNSLSGGSRQPDISWRA